MDIWSQISGLKDGTPLDETTFNAPIYQLKARTDYLKARIQALIDAGALSSVKYADVALAAGTGAPAVGDVVTLDPATGLYVKALYRNDPVTGDLTDNAHAVGVLVDSRNGRGVVTACGIVSAFDVVSMLEPGEVFSPGVYRLSHRVPGKVTARYAQGATPICTMLDLDDAGNPRAAFVSVQQKDPGADHRHSGVRLQSQVNGTLMASDEYGVEYVIVGFEPRSAQEAQHGVCADIDDAEDPVSGATLYVPSYNFTFGNYAGLTIGRVVGGEIVETAVITNNNSSTIAMAPALTFNPADEYGAEADGWVILPRTRLRISGTYSGVGATYTLGLTDQTGVLGLDVGWPKSGGTFADVWLKWTSSDPDEGEGLVQVRGYEVPVPFGAHGCVATLENTLDNQYDWPEMALEYPDRRTWTVAVPDSTAGWSNRHVNELLGGGSGPALSLFGLMPTGHVDVYASAGNMTTLAYSVNPVAGDTVRIGADTYVFVAGDEEVESGLTGVQLGASAAESYLALAAAARANGVIAGSNGTRFIVAGQSVVAADMVMMPTIAASAGGGDITTAAFLVVDADGNNLVNSGSGLWVPGAYCTPVALTSGLQLQALAYTLGGDAAGVIDPTATYIAEVDNEAPGAEYVYSAGMDRSLGRVYPPAPVTAASLLLNGAEVNNAAVHPDDADWKAGLAGIYWYGRTDALPFETDAALDVTLYTTTTKAPESGVVTSLAPAADSPVKTYRCGTRTPASSGDLEVDFKLELSTTDSDLDDYYAVKRVSGNRLRRGPVVSKIVAGSGISLASPANVPLGTGQVTIGLTSGGGFEGVCSDIVLRNAKQAMIGMFPYIRFPGQLKSDGTPIGSGEAATPIQSGISARFQVPTTLGAPNVQTNFLVYIYVTMFGEHGIADGAPLNARFNMRYAILRDYSGAVADYSGTFLDTLITPAADLLREVPVGFDTPPAEYGDPAPTYKPFDPFITHNDPSFLVESGRASQALGAAFPDDTSLKGGIVAGDAILVAAQPGSFVGIELDRVVAATGQAGAYNGHIGITSIRWRLAPLAT